MITNQILIVASWTRRANQIFFLWVFLSVLAPRDVYISGWIDSNLITNQLNVNVTQQSEQQFAVWQRRIRDIRRFSTWKSQFQRSCQNLSSNFSLNSDFFVLFSQNCKIKSVWSNMKKSYQIYKFEFELRSTINDSRVLNPPPYIWYCWDRCVDITMSLKTRRCAVGSHASTTELICSYCLNRLNQSHSWFCWIDKGVALQHQVNWPGLSLTRSEPNQGKKNWKDFWFPQTCVNRTNHIQTFQIRSGLDWKILPLNPVCARRGVRYVNLLGHFDPERDATHKFVAVVIVTQIWTFDFTLDRLLDVIILFS